MRFALLCAAVCVVAVLFRAAPAFGGEDAEEAAYSAELERVREDLFAQYMREAARPEGARLGTRLAWSLIRVGNAGPETRVDLDSFRHDDGTAELRVRHRGEDAFIRMDGTDDRRRVRATVGGYRFNTGYAVLLQKPLSWMAKMAGELREAGVAPEAHAEWEVTEAPEGLIAFAGTDAAGGSVVPAAAFFRGAVREVRALPEPEDFGSAREEFLAAAEALHRGVMDDGSIPQDLRLALEPVLAGTYSAVDPRDYFDNEFCRRLIEADYLEKFLAPLPAARAEELARYRRALAKIEAGVDRFAVDLGAEGRLVAVSRPEIGVAEEENAPAAEETGREGADGAGGGESAGALRDAPGVVRDPETGETLSRYNWRWERGQETVFHSPLPSRYLYAMTVTEAFPGRHRLRPAGVPARTEVWHAVLGSLARHRPGAAGAEGDTAKWQEAVELDARGGRDPNAGPLGWSFPLFVPVRDGQGDPVLVATERGVMYTPDFGAFPDGAARRAAQDRWLDNAALTLATPGELNLLYRIFFRYCSDSPLPELPNLIGSHLGLSDTHQTVYQTLDRRWVGRLIGDCDDMAEFFQNIAVRQGRLAQVMQLPSHAAAGWLDAAADVEGEDPGSAGYEFVVLQTGPALRFTAATRTEAVEKAYRHFEQNVGESQFTVSAVPLLLRFADEETRTSFVLSARIYWDREYAEKMTAVQEYWHLHTYAAGIAAMRTMLETDRDPGNIKELASLYEQVGAYAEAAELREEELATAGGDALAALATLSDMAELQVRAKNRDAAFAALDAMRDKLAALRIGDADLYARAFAYRAAWALLLARLDAPEKAWPLFRHDVAAAEADGWRVSEPLLRVLTTLYDRMALRRDQLSAAGGAEGADAERIRIETRNALAHAFGAGYFTKADSFNDIASKCYWLGRYAVAVAGREAGLARLAEDGPYPSAPDAGALAARTAELSDRDWAWFRITPRLLFGLGLEMLDREEYPERYDPAGAERVLALVPRAAEKAAAAGAGLPDRETPVQAALVLSFVRNDLPAFERLMAEVRAKDYSGLYNDAATMFGSYAGLVPEAEFGGWIAAFRAAFPGRQHYFQAAYRMLAKGHAAHAVAFAEATAGFFPDDALLVAEAAALREAALAKSRNIE